MRWPVCFAGTPPPTPHVPRSSGVAIQTTVVSGSSCPSSDQLKEHMVLVLVMYICVSYCDRPMAFVIPKNPP